MKCIPRIEFLYDYPALVPVVASWLHDAWGDLSPWNSVEKISRSLEQRFNRDRAPLALVAFDAAEPIGTASIKQHEIELYPDREHWLGEVFVLPSYRGRGVGSALTNRIVNIASSLRMEQLFLYTPDQEPLYRRLGWATIDRMPHHGEEVVVMQRRV